MRVGILICLLTPIALAGCQSALTPRTQTLIAELPVRVVDAQAATPKTKPPSPPASLQAPIVLAAHEQADGKKPDRLQIPPGLPGANAAPIQLPKYDPDNPKERNEAIQRLFSPLPALPADPVAAPGPAGRPLTLLDLQQMAQASSPLLRQASAEVQAARGGAIQAGLWPNPIVGYEGDTINQANTAGLQGAFIEQTIITGGKLRVAQAAAAIEIANAELRLRKTQVEVATAVRTQYFALLAAQEYLKAARALATFTDEIFRIQIDLLKAGQAAPYEPMQLRVLTMQAHSDLQQAQQRLASAWRQLTAALGRPDLPLTQVENLLDAPLPAYEYEHLQARMLAGHTDLQTAHNRVLKARLNLRKAQLTPLPDVRLRAMVQKDNTTPPFNTVPSIVVGLNLPAWDRNQGGILQAEGELLAAQEEYDRVHNDLSGRLAQAYETYQNQRQLLAMYRDSILPDQVRAYRGVYERHRLEPEKATFGDIVNAQQTLAAAVKSYLTTLGSAWSAMVEIARLLQADELCEPGRR